MPAARTESGDTRRTPEGRALYTCDNCGKTEPWNDDWAWYGSYRQAEDYGLPGIAPVRTICSATCRVALVAVGKIPADGLNDHGEVEEEMQHRQTKRRGL